MNQPLCGIYGLQNTINGKWYVGQSRNIKRRWYSAYELLRCKNQIYLYRALCKYGYENFEKVILEECPLDKLNERECYWSIEKNSMVPNGYNLKVGGGQTVIVSEETKRKIGDAHRGKKIPQHAIEKSRAFMLSDKNPHRGKKRGSPSDITRKKISEANKGKPAPNKGIPCTEEMKKRIGQTLLGRPSPKKGVKYGPVHSEEWKKKMSSNMKSDGNPFFGRRHTEETKMKMRKAKRKLVADFDKSLPPEITLDVGDDPLVSCIKPLGK